MPVAADRNMTALLLEAFLQLRNYILCFQQMNTTMQVEVTKNGTA